MNIHRLKTHVHAFDATWLGIKPFEVRVNDRAGGFQVGDCLFLMEYDDKNTAFTGRAMLANVCFVLHAPGFGGVVENHCVMSLSDIRRYDRITGLGYFPGQAKVIE